jgi:drug/metabolite transporter (DMT)-like permease
VIVRKTSTAKVAIAFAAVYLIWGSTYLAIRYAIQTMPPLLMASARFLLAGAILYTWSSLKSVPAPPLKEWRQAFTIGAMMMLGGNGCVVLSEQYVPSGLAAILVATVPLWIAVFNWIRPGGRRPIRQVALGIVLGFGGVILLTGLGNLRGAGSVDPRGAVLLVFSSMSWASGSLYSKNRNLSDSPLQASGMTMIGGGTSLLVAGLIHGEAAQFHPYGFSMESVLALGYLAILGSVVGFTAYNWLLKATTPSRASTYAYVNPAVAVVLGRTIGGEAITSRMMMSLCVIVAAVIIITTARKEEDAALPG